MKERAKLYKPQRDRKTHTLSKRLSSGGINPSSSQSQQQPSNKRLNTGESLSQSASQGKQQDVNMKPPGKWLSSFI